MSNRATLLLAACWAAAILAAAVLDAPPGFASMLPAIAFATLLPRRRRCAATVR